ncbi:MAG TPA: hypothetical protein DCM86_07350 [Verrucomicrobiales bacterium]|nr:hypothetical protein [Verrucomicrobiales bacterium]
MNRALVVSLWMNLLLLGAVAWKHPTSQAPDLSRSPRGHTSTGVALTTAGRPQPDRGDLPATPWSLLDSSNPAILMAHLRAAGCPEETVQDIIVLRLSRKAYATALSFAADHDRAVPYWRGVDPGEERRFRTRLGDLRDGLATQLEGLFGKEMSAIRTRLLGLPEMSTPESYLPGEKERALRALWRSYDRLDRERSESATEVPYGWSDPSQESARLESLQEREDEIRNLLTPAEYEEYRFHDSPAAKFVRRELPEAQTVEEFRRMVAKAEESGVGFAPPGASMNAVAPPPGTPDPQAAWRDRFQKFRQSLVQELGEDRIAEQQRLETARVQAEQEELGRSEMAAVAREAGLTTEEMQSFYEYVQGLGPELSARFQAARQEATTPEERALIDAEEQAEMEALAADVFGAEKARQLIDVLRRR